MDKVGTQTTGPKYKKFENYAQDLTFERRTYTDSKCVKKIKKG